MYADTSLEVSEAVPRLSVEGAGGEGLNVQPSLVAKGVCKGKSCPSLHRRKAHLEGCSWESVNKREIIIEESSGWYYFWFSERPASSKVAAPDSGDEGRQPDEHVGEKKDTGSVTEKYPPFFSPLLPTKDELSTIKSNGEHGYLKRGKAGAIIFDD